MVCLLHGFMLYIACLAAWHQEFVSAYNTVLCEEDPPPCSFKYDHDDFTPQFETREQGCVNSHKHRFDVDGTQDICSLDPFINVDPNIQKYALTVDMRFEVNCAMRSTRIVLRPSMNLTATHIFSYIFFHKCTVYWKDLSLFGQLIKTLVLKLFDSRDEFTEDKRHFFDKCVVYEDSSNSSENGVYPIVRGLRDLGTLAMTGSLSSGLHPLLLNHSWPALAEVTLHG